MRNFILFCFLFLLIFVSTPSRALAFADPLPSITKTSDISAHFLQNEEIFAPADLRVLQLRNYLLKWKSPLADSSELIIYAADAYTIPWTLVPAIAGVESGFCRSIIRNSYNCWGWRNGVHRFVSYEEAIITISQSLRLGYYDKGFTTIERIAPRYAPPSPHWGEKVRFFMEKIERQLPLDSSYLQISI